MANQESVTVRAYRSADEQAVVSLWARCELTRPWNDPHEDVRRKLAVQPEMFLVAVAAGEVVGTVMAGYDGHRGWINYLVVASDCRGRGIGRGLMEEAERLLRGLGCPKINLQVRAGNTAAVEFYRRLGYARDDVVSLGKRLVADEDAGK